MCKKVPKPSNQLGPPLRCFGCLSEPLKTLSCVVHQIHQTAVEGQGTHTCAELSKKFFILPCKDFSLLPEIKGSKDMGSDGDV